MLYLINSDFGQNQIIALKGAKTTKQTELEVNNLSDLIFSTCPNGWTKNNRYQSQKTAHPLRSTWITNQQITTGFRTSYAGSS